MKSILTALWMSAATLGTMYGIAWWETGHAAESAEDGTLYTAFKSATLSVPVFRDSRVDGYMVLRFEGEMEAGFAALASPPPDIAHEHAAYSAVQALGGQVDLSRPETVDRSAVAAQLARALDDIARRPVTRNIVITELNFLRRADHAPSS